MHLSGAQPEPEFTLQCTRKQPGHFPACVNTMLLQAEAPGIACENGGNAVNSLCILPIRMQAASPYGMIELEGLPAGTSEMNGDG